MIETPVYEKGYPSHEAVNRQKIDGHYTKKVRDTTMK